MNALIPIAVTGAPLLRAIQGGEWAGLSELAILAERKTNNIVRDLSRLEEAGLVSLEVKTRPVLTPVAIEQLAALDRASAPDVMHGQIERDPLNPRRVFHEEPLQALAESIWDDGKLTVLQPLVIRPRDGAAIPYRLVAGERRHRAIEILINDGRWPAGKPVPVSIRILSDEEAAVLALVENMQREDLSAVDEALTFEHLRTSLEWSNADIAKHIKRTPEYVQQRLRVLKLDADIQARMRLPKTDENRIGFKEARKLFTVSKEPTRPKAPELSPKLALALLELAHKVESAPMTVNAEPGFTVLTQRPTGGALATLNERKIVVLREWGGQVFAKIQLYTSGAVTFLEDIGFYGPKRDEVIWAARTAVMSPQRASEATRSGRYITPELNTELAPEKPASDDEAADAEEVLASAPPTKDPVWVSAYEALDGLNAKQRCALVEVVDKVHFAPMTEGGWQGYAEVYNPHPDPFRLADVLIRRLPAGFMSWQGRQGVHLSIAGYERAWLASHGLLTAKGDRAAILLAARSAVVGYEKAKALADADRYLTPWLNADNQTNPVRPDAERAVTQRMAEISSQLSAASDQMPEVDTATADELDEDADEEALDTLVGGVRETLHQTLGSSRRWNDPAVDHDQLAADAVTAFMGGRLIDAVIALMGLYHRADDIEDAERLLRKAAEGRNRPEGEEPEAKLFRAAKATEQWLLDRYNDVFALEGVDATYGALCGALNDVSQAKKVEPPLLILRPGDVVEKYPGGATAHRLLAREDDAPRVAFRAQPIRNGKDYGKPAKLSLNEIAAFAR